MSGGGVGCVFDRLVCVLCRYDWSIFYSLDCVWLRDKSGRRGDFLRVVYLYD